MKLELRVASACLALALAGGSADLTWAQDAAPSASAAASAAPSIDAPLPPLPEMESIALAPATAEAVEALRDRLAELANLKADDALAEVDLKFLTAGVSRDMVSAIAQELMELKGRISSGAASSQLEKARKRGRKAIKKWKKAHKGYKKADVPDGDWLVFFLASDKRDSDGWRDACQLYGMLRMLEVTGTTPAVRELIASYSAFGELVRVDLQRSLSRLKDRAVPALLEAKKHDARKVRLWAQRQLDNMGKSIPGEAVSTTDPDVLADVLRAFGRIRDIDATRIIISYANSERLQLRQAARESLVALGAPAEWHLKDIYKTQTGKPPPRDWDHKRVTQELFRLYDRSRLAVVYGLVDQGKKATKKGDTAAAVKAYDQALARAPLLPERHLMAQAYIAHSDVLRKEDKLGDALMALRKAERLAEEKDLLRQIKARVTYVEARELADNGTPDLFLSKKALELDPENAEAKELVDELTSKQVAEEGKGQKYAIAAGVGGIGIAVVLLLARGRRRKEDEPDTAEDPTEDAAP